MVEEKYEYEEEFEEEFEDQDELLMELFNVTSDEDLEDALDCYDPW